MNGDCNLLHSPTTRCPSGSALTRVRGQIVISGECNDIIEVGIECKSHIETNPDTGPYANW